MTTVMEDAVEIFGDRHHTRRLVVTCEHASNRVPPPLQPSPEDQRWLETHWGWDIGAAAVTRELVQRKACVALLSRFSRLVCDPNRGAQDPSLILTEVEGQPLSFNQNVDGPELARRLLCYHEPYHQLIDSCLGERVARGGDVVLFSIHSFTPVFEGVQRNMEMGVLFDRYEPIARRFAQHLEDQGFVTALNEPYSGIGNRMHAMQRHGQRHGVVNLELEIRQDLLQSPEEIRDVASRLCDALTALQIRESDRME